MLTKGQIYAIAAIVGGSIGIVAATPTRADVSLSHVLGQLVGVADACDLYLEPVDNLEPVIRGVQDNFDMTLEEMDVDMQNDFLDGYDKIYRARNTFVDVKIQEGYAKAEARRMVCTGGLLVIYGEQFVQR